MVDIKRGGFRHESVWLALTHRLAAMGGALAALTALLFEAPVHVASLRGGLTWLGVLTVGRGATWLARRTWRPPVASAAPQNNSLQEAQRAA